MQSIEAKEIIAALRETLETVKGLRSITISTDEGNELIAVTTSEDSNNSSVNRDRAAVFAGAAEQVLKLGKGGMNVTTAFYSSQVAVLVLTKPLIISIVGDLETNGLDLASVKALVEPLKKLVEPLRQSVEDTR